jgi:hypothetical protein
MLVAAAVKALTATVNGQWMAPASAMGGGLAWRARGSVPPSRRPDGSRVRVQATN